MCFVGQNVLSSSACLQLSESKFQTYALPINIDTSDKNTSNVQGIVNKFSSEEHNTRDRM